MNRSRPVLAAAGIVLGGFGFGGGGSAAAQSLNVANASFELPVFADGGFQNGPTLAQQGGYGWTMFVGVGDSAGIANTDATLYTNANGNNTPLGAAGPQTGFIFGSGGLAVQTLAGPDATPGNGDDPLLQPNTVYTITVAAGQRLPGGPFSVPYGDLDIRLLAGTNPFLSPIIGESADFTPPAGTFADVTFVVDSATVSPALYGSPLSIAFRQNVFGAAADSDNVRITAVPEPAVAAGLMVLGRMAAAAGRQRGR